MFSLSIGLLVLLIIAIIAACLFEFINGFHDTANAVATVIYTNSLKPLQAVALSGIFNMLGVFVGGLSVAMGIVNLMPLDVAQTQTQQQLLLMILAIMSSAIIWNFATWYWGIPSSSSHTLIGAILGGGLAVSLLPGHTFGDGINWGKAQSIGVSLFISPLFGFSFGALLLILAKVLFKNKTLHQTHEAGEKPPTWIRSLMALTCVSISFFHGQNDGQKGIGLVMMILICALPGYYALNTTKDIQDIKPIVERMELAAMHIEASSNDKVLGTEASKLKTQLYNFKVQYFGYPAVNGNKTSAKTENESFNVVKTQYISDENKNDPKKETVPTNTDKKTPLKEQVNIRVSIAKMTKSVDKLSQQPQVVEKFAIEAQTLKQGAKELRAFTDYAPFWVILMISLCLGVGTVIGWKRVVVTVGEKIGKSGMTYSQGLTSGVVASTTIGLSSGLGLPVSTTHVLSSAIAGTMTAQGGMKNLQMSTIKKIVLAWVLTLPVSMILSMLLFFLYRLFA